MAALRATRRVTPPGLLLVVILRASALAAVLTAAHGDRLRDGLLSRVVPGSVRGAGAGIPHLPLPHLLGAEGVMKGDRLVPCTRCWTTGRIKRFGATTIHRVFWRVAGNPLMARRKAILADLRKLTKENAQ